MNNPDYEERVQYRGYTAILVYKHRLESPMIAIETLLDTKVFLFSDETCYESDWVCQNDAKNIADDFVGSWGKIVDASLA